MDRRESIKAIGLGALSTGLLLGGGACPVLCGLFGSPSGSRINIDFLSFTWVSQGGKDYFFSLYWGYVCS